MTDETDTCTSGIDHSPPNSEKSEQPHWHASKVPIGVIFPSDFSIAAYTEPQASHIAANRRLLSICDITPLSVLTVDKDSLRTVGTTDARVVHPDTDQSGGRDE